MHDSTKYKMYLISWCRRPCYFTCQQDKCLNTVLVITWERWGQQKSLVRNKKCSMFLFLAKPDLVQCRKTKKGKPEAFMWSFIKGTLFFPTVFACVHAHSSSGGCISVPNRLWALLIFLDKRGLRCVQSVSGKDRFTYCFYKELIFQEVEYLQHIHTP